MNQTIEQLLSHRSVRHFKKQALTDKQKQQLITAAQAGSSSNFYKHTIIEIKDLSYAELGRLANCEDYVVNTGVFYVLLLICIVMQRFCQRGAIIGTLKDTRIIISSCR